MKKRRGMLDRMEDLLFPRRCMGCDAIVAGPGREGWFCGSCAPEAALYELGSAFGARSCGRCGLGVLETGMGSCEGCRGWPMETVRARWEYGGPVAQAIREAKYAGRADLLRGLAEEARGWLDGELERLGPDLLVVPVPMHPADVRRRGFNQAAVLVELWRGVFRGRGARARWGVVRKGARTASQAGLGRVARQQNLAAAFEVVAADRVCGREVLVVDDVLTTGATMAALSASLEAAGARAVHGLALARSLVGVAGGEQVLKLWEESFLP